MSHIWLSFESRSFHKLKMMTFSWRQPGKLSGYMDLHKAVTVSSYTEFISEFRAAGFDLCSREAVSLQRKASAFFGSGTEGIVLMLSSHLDYCLILQKPFGLWVSSSGVQVLEGAGKPVSHDLESGLSSDR